LLAERAPERLGINKNIYTIKTRPRLAKVSFKWFCLITEKAIRQDIIVNNKDIFRLAIEFENHKVPFELHFFQWGAHGLSLGDGYTANTVEQIDLHYAKWFDLCIEWINRQIDDI